MAQRYEINETVLKASGGFFAAPGAKSAQVNSLSGTGLTVYQSETGGSTHSTTGALTSDQFGRIEGWVEAPDFDIVVSGSGITTYTQKVRASPSGVIDAKSYGVKADGTTDDSVAWAAAAAVAQGKTIHHTGGTSLVNATAITILTQCHVQGRGKASIIKLKNGVTPGQGVFQVINCDGVWFRDLVIDLNKANTTDPASYTAGMGIYFVASGGAGITNCGVHNVTIKDGHQNGIFGNGSFPVQTLDLAIQHCNITGCKKKGVYIEGTGGQVVIAHNRLSGNNSAEGGSGQIQVTGYIGSGDIIIDGNRCVSGSSNGIAVAQCDNVRIVNNYCASNGLTGVISWGIVVSQDVKYFTVANNRCHGNGSGGISVDLQEGVLETIKNAHGTVAGNICSGGIDFHGIYVQYAKGVSVTGNHCFDNTHSGIMLTNGAQGCTVSGNVCWDNTLNGIVLTDAGGATADGGKHTVTGNNCFTNGTNYLDSATLRSKYSGNESDTSTTVASAATITVPPEHHHISITGSTTITSITANVKDKIVTLVWAAAATFDVTDGSNLKLSASITTFDADDTLTLMCDGTNWHEVSRSVN